jgi:cytoskeleton protein RodZ
MLDKFAQELKEFRLSQDLTLQQVSVRTRIDYKFLESMESGDFEFLPELYVKAFVREYIKTLGLDETLYMKKYEAARSGKYFEETTKPVEPSNIETEKPLSPSPPPVTKKATSADEVRSFKRLQEEGSASNRKKAKMIYYFGAAGVIVLIISFLFFFKDSNEIVVPEKTWDEIIEDRQNRYNETQEEISDEVPAGTESYALADTLKLTIKAVDTTWIRILLDDSSTEEFILFPGSQKLMKAANNYKIVFGNASGVQLFLNEKPLSFVSKGSSVQRVQIDSSGLKNLEQNTAIE